MDYLKDQLDEIRGILLKHDVPYEDTSRVFRCIQRIVVHQGRRLVSDIETELGWRNPPPSVADEFPVKDCNET